MVFGIADVQLEALQLDAAAQRQPRTVARFTLAVFNLHLVRASEVITCRHIELCTQHQVAANGQMLDETLVPIVEA